VSQPTTRDPLPFREWLVARRVVQKYFETIMNSINFVTTNKGKLATLQRYFDVLEINIPINQCDIDIIEPQADTATEVAKSKARTAFEMLHQPVLVDDSSFHIAALGGFPGPYIKFMLSTIGIEGIMNFMEGKHDRSAYFLSSLVYIDAAGNEHVFEDESYTGTLAKKIVEVKHPRAWGDLHKVFIPTGTNKVLAELSDEEKDATNKENDSYYLFSLWLKARLKK
jgi:non-canonical purine NTP pyrophosphatase (RdgB/HAM1 family)